MGSDHAPGHPPPLTTLLASGPVALFLDFDGTLVELAPGPDDIEPQAGLADSLATLDIRMGRRCAVVSGRGLSDIEGHIGPLKIAGAGSHGSDMRRADGSLLGHGAQGLPSEIEAELRAYAAQHGLNYEEKPHGGALHYRQNPDAGPDAETFAQELATAHGWAAQSGKCVVEVVAKTANKGAAVKAFMKEPPFKGATPFFIGDDLTDEAGFEACEALGGAGILVGSREQTTARYRLDDVSAVHTWLEI